MEGEGGEERVEGERGREGAGKVEERREDEMEEGGMPFNSGQR